MTTLVLAGHGTRSARGEETIADLTDLVRRVRPGVRVERAFLEISSPPLAGVLPTLPGPVVVVPLLLAGGYHVHIDLPSVVAQARPGAVVAAPLGPHPLLAAVLARRLAAAGLRAADSVILAAAGSSDPAALADVRAAARLLAVRLSRPVTAAFAATGHPPVAEALERLRSGPAPRVAVASYLLAPGFFHDRLRECGADLVTAPLGVDADLAALVWARFDQARRSAAGQARRGSSLSSRMISSALSSRDGR
ncbi:sirohydrochlorin ferrochelatase [Streptosporangium becharense]|uniref:Sirohydrochlorin ferrochelatase n=1 Tax=Streptosporangium becharense TaxID=1816182 RepID=A0A7W9MF22_9ACTN|nr:CbiX/SirB N-terminal domain-containing protein [Streptosporangium becharense]MBB2913777.1 sirohydrochlorin ferrochelatase [Streptosporangium becharense]MBB5817858.1 sirohydrochlorin ferrochelatase [Streptosporangium becharense]